MSRKTLFSVLAIPLLLLGVVQSGLLSFDSRGFFDEGLPRLRVVLDPGHGGDEWGATGYGLIERDSNLDMAKRVGALLEQADIDVVYTRMDDGRATRDGRMLWGYSAIFADIDSRIAIANEAKADLCISIHSNGFQDPSARGIEVMYTPGREFSYRSLALAEAIAPAWWRGSRRAGTTSIKASCRRIRGWRTALDASRRSSSWAQSGN